MWFVNLLKSLLIMLGSTLKNESPKTDDKGNKPTSAIKSHADPAWASSEAFFASFGRASIAETSMIGKTDRYKNIDL